MIPRALVCAMVALACCGGARAAPGDAVSPVIAADALAVSASGPVGRARVPLQAPPGAALVVHVEPRLWSDRLGNIPATWTRLPEGAAVEPGQPLTIAAGSSATLQVEGTLPRAGAYTTFVRVDASAASSGREVKLTITRAVPEVPTDFLVAPNPVRIDLALFPLGHFGRARGRQVRMIGHNAGAVDLDLGGARLGEVSRLEGDAAIGLATRPLFELVADNCRGWIAIKASCALTLQVPPNLAPGRYKIDVAVEGTSGGQSTRTLTLEVRASAWIAGLVVALGVLLGLGISTWRTTGQPLVVQLVATATTRDRLRSLAAGATGRVKTAYVRLLAEIDALNARIAGGEDAHVDCSALGTRVDALIAADEALRAVADGEAGVRTMLAPMVAALEAAFSATNWDAATLSAATGALREEYNALPRLKSAVDAANQVHDSYSDLWPLAEKKVAAEIQAAWRALEVGLRNAASAIQPVPKKTVAAERAIDLEASCRTIKDNERVIAQAALAVVIARLKALPEPTEAQKQLLARAEAMTNPSAKNLADFVAQSRETLPADQSPSMALGAGVANPIIPAIDGALAFLDDPLLGSSLANLSPRALRLIGSSATLLANAAVLVLTAAIGVLTLWAQAPAWGTPSDLVIALLAGAGTRLAIGALPGALKG